MGGFEARPSTEGGTGEFPLQANRLLRGDNNEFTAKRVSRWGRSSGHNDRVERNRRRGTGQPKRPGQRHLTDVTVQIPIALAANVCDVNVAVLVSALTDVGAADCTGSADSDATVTRADGGRGPIRQRGLVNVNVTDLVVQVPVGIAANICDVNAGVLVGLLTDVGAADCEATGTAGAITG